MDERKVRYELAKRGIALRKDRARMRSLDHQGGYMIVDPYRKWVVDGAHFELSLDEVIEFVAARDDVNGYARDHPDE